MLAAIQKSHISFGSSLEGGFMLWSWYLLHGLPGGSLPLCCSTLTWLSFLSQLECATLICGCALTGPHCAACLWTADCECAL